MTDTIHSPKDVLAHNRAAWDSWVEQGDRWTTPVTPAEIAAARDGEWAIYLTEDKPAPRDWFPADLRGVDVLCLACLLYTSPSPRDRTRSRMPSSA